MKSSWKRITIQSDLLFPFLRSNNNDQSEYSELPFAEIKERKPPLVLSPVWMSTKKLDQQRRSNYMEEKLAAAGCESKDLLGRVIGGVRPGSMMTPLVEQSWSSGSLLHIRGTGFRAANLRIRAQSFDAEEESVQERKRTSQQCRDFAKPRRVDSPSRSIYRVELSERTGRDIGSSIQPEVFISRTSRTGPFGLHEFELTHPECSALTDSRQRHKF